MMLCMLSILTRFVMNLMIFLLYWLIELFLLVYHNLYLQLTKYWLIELFLLVYHNLYLQLTKKSNDELETP